MTAAPRARAGELADCLIAVRRGAPLLDPPPVALAPPTLDAAYAVADLVVAALERRDGPVRAYKVGATSTRGQQMLGLAEPFYGRSGERAVLPDGATWPLVHADATVEAEVGFVLGRELPPRATPYSETEVTDAVLRAVPLLEINRPAYARPFEVGGLWLVADNGVTQGVIVGGPGREPWSRPPLAAETVRLHRGGEACATGIAEVVLGDPIRAVHWLANALNARGRGLRAGDVVASGAMTPPVPLRAGEYVVADYSTLGRVSVRVVAAEG